MAPSNSPTLDDPLSPLTASQDSSDETQRTSDTLIPWSPSPPPAGETKIEKRSRKPVKPLGVPLLTRSRAAASSEDSAEATLPKRLLLKGPKLILDTTGYQGSIAASVASVPSSAVLAAPLPRPSGGFQTKLALKRKFTTPPASIKSNATHSMASSGPGYTQDEFQQFLKFQAMMAASKQQSDSPSLPSTPPPNTSNQASSSSKASSRGSTSSSVKTPKALTPQTSQQKPAIKTSPLKRKEPDSPSKKDESKSQGKKKAAGEDSPSPKKSKTDRNSKDDDEDEKVLKTEDYMNVETLPDVCEVWDESVQEPSMTEEYKKLPNCEKAIIVSWDPQPGEGNVPLSCWPELSDQYDEDVFYNILSFTQQGRYVNLARVDPRKCRAAKTNMGPNRHKWILEIEERTAICVSLIALIESCLSEAGTLHNSGKGLVSKFVTGHLHSYEAERTIGVIGMVFRLKEMYGQISKDAFTFSTKPIPKDSNSSPSKTSGKRKFKGVASGATAASSSATWGSNEALSFDADIPVYDARGSTFDINEHIEDLDTHLPRYSGSEIPEMTLSAVGYTVNQYMDKDSRQTVTFNLQFVIVLGESNLESSED